MLQLSHVTPDNLHAAGLEPIGPIVRLQVQTSSLKLGERPHRWYDPSPVSVVAGLQVDDGGVTGLDDAGELVADVHHRDHVHSKHSGMNGVSIGFTSHYSQMRDRFGDHLTNGIAAENVLVETGDAIAERDLAGGVVLLTARGTIVLAGVHAAPPCVEFSKFCTGYGRDQRSDHVVTEALQFLSDGTRGFYATLGDIGFAPAVCSPGDLACRILPR